MAKRGRPKKQIDLELAHKLAFSQCTHEEIATEMDCTARTLQKDKDYMKIYRKATNAGKAWLRQQQMKMAQKDRQMLIWLGKQHLGQAERSDSNVKVDERVTIVDDIK